MCVNKFPNPAVSQSGSQSVSQSVSLSVCLSLHCKSFPPCENNTFTIRHIILGFLSCSVYLCIYLWFYVEPQCLDYCGFVAYFEITKYNTSGFGVFFSFNIALGIWGLLCFLMNFGVSIFLILW